VAADHRPGLAEGLDRDAAVGGRAEVAREQLGDDRLLGAARLEREPVERAGLGCGIRTNSAVVGFSESALSGACLPGSAVVRLSRSAIAIMLSS